MAAVQVQHPVAASLLRYLCSLLVGHVRRTCTGRYARQAHVIVSSLRKETQMHGTLSPSPRVVIDKRRQIKIQVVCRRVVGINTKPGVPVAYSQHPIEVSYALTSSIRFIGNIIII
jgi:hypothetical protein